MTRQKSTTDISSKPTWEIIWSKWVSIWYFSLSFYTGKYRVTYNVFCACKSTLLCMFNSISATSKHSLQLQFCSWLFSPFHFQGHFHHVHAILDSWFSCPFSIKVMAMINSLQFQFWAYCKNQTNWKQKCMCMAMYSYYDSTMH